jgi:hypothetical protein
LRSFEFSGVCFTNGVSQAVLAAFEKGSLVAKLQFTDCYLRSGLSDDHTVTIQALVQARTVTIHALVQVLQRNSSVKSVSLVGNYFHELFYEGITTVLLVNTTLVDLTLRAEWAEDGGRWLQPLLAAMRINSSLKSLDVDTFHLTNELVCGALRDALANNSVLESLTLRSPERLDGAGVVSWRKTLPFIRDNATLKSLTISLTSGLVLDPFMSPIF